MKLKNKLRGFFAFTGSVMLVATTSHAANLYWDGGTINIAGNGDGAGTSATGTWNTTIQNWDGGVSPHVAWDNVTNAADTADIFASGNYAINITSNINLGGLNTTWSGANRVLSLSSTTSTLNFSAGSVISNVQASSTNTGTFAITAGISGGPIINLTPYTTSANVFNPSSGLSQDISAINVTGVGFDSTQTLNGAANTVNYLDLFHVVSNSGAQRHNLNMDSTATTTWEIGGVSSAVAIGTARITMAASGGLMKFTGDVAAQTLTVGNAVNDNATAEFSKSGASLAIDVFQMAGGLVKNSSGGSLTFITAIADNTNNNRITQSGIRFEGNDMVFQSNRNIKINTPTATVDVITAGQTVTFATLSEVTGPRALTKAGLGTLLLSGTSTYTGITTVSAGTLHLSKNTSLYNNVEANWTAAKINVLSGATLALNVDSGGTAGFTSTKLNTLFTNISVANTATEGLQSGATLGFDTSNATGGTFTQGNAIANSTGSGSFHGAIGLTKLGAGTLVLDKANTYTGTTTISQGTLALSGSGSIASSSQIQINSSTTLDVTAVTGSFTVGSAQTVSGGGTLLATGKTVVANGTLSPGNSPGTLVQDAGTLQLGANGSMNWQIFNANGVAGTGYDTVSLINGATLDLSALSVGNEYNINLWSLSGIGPDVNGDATNFNNTLSYAWTLFSTGAVISNFNANLFEIFIAANNGTNGFTNTLNGGTFGVSLADGGTDIVLTYTAIPEPRAALLGGLGFLMLLRRRRF